MTNEFMLALVAWRECRSGGVPGMQSVMNCACNTAAERKTSIYAEIVRPLRYSSITAPRDPQLNLWPAENDPRWMDAIKLALSAVRGSLPDITGGATQYYALSMAEPPAWASEMTKTAVIAGQQFLKT